jgi:uncharacterized LabA/DUF88 family protein
MENNYFFVDGSALLADISALQGKIKSYKAKKVDIKKVIDYFASSPSLSHFHSQAYKRFVLYALRQDKRIKELLILPDPKTPGAIVDFRLEECGKRIPEDARAAAWLDEKNAPLYVRERLRRSEKAVDTQICCDALQLAAVNQLERLFLYTNDYDFVPLCRTLRSFGININLFRLDNGRINKSLTQEFDGFDVMPRADLDNCFV